MSPGNKGKPMFPNRRSAVISIAVVLFLLIFAGVAIDQNNVSRLKRYKKEAIAFLDQGMDAIDDRFMYATTLVDLLDDHSLAGPIEDLVSSYSREKSPSLVSELYVALDKELALLQIQVFTDKQYPLYAAYFEKIYDAEQEMALYLNEYNDKALYYNVQIGGFLATLAAKRLGMQPLELFSVAPAIKGRP
ncbi:MAG TPA: hypothetical protein DCG32_05130 [Sphaerochaeta sp.]|nr:hypothetical protein [Sphaerochaeta sp.]